MRRGFFVFWIGMAAAQAGVITVTTPNNTNPPAGQTSLLQALSTATNGDVIRFNLPGSGPHYLVTPPGGYPHITAHSLTIDGYSQPGSAPNTNSILRPNNARIQVVLDSRLGGHKLMDFPGDTPNDDTGYGNVEGNVVMNNYPPELFGPASPNIGRSFQPDFLEDLEDTGTVSLRGNTLVNNFTPPVNPLKNGSTHLTNYYSRVLASTTNRLSAVLSTNTSIARLVGTLPPPAANCPHVTLDLYVPDPEGLTNGIAAGIPGLTNGFHHGDRRGRRRAWLPPGPGTLNSPRPLPPKTTTSAKGAHS